jgi:hypothetical protein
MSSKTLASGHERTRITGGVYRYKRGEFEWRIEKLRSSVTGNSGHWGWFVISDNELTRNLIMRLHHQDVVGDCQTLRDAECSMAAMEGHIQPQDHHERYD